MTYSRARNLLLLSGMILIALLGLIAVARGVDHIEVIGTLLFLPVFVAFLLFGIRGGFWFGLLASVVYVILRIPSLRLLGLTPLSGQLAARVIGYLGFGVGGGWASQQVKSALDKLAMQDDIDDETGLGNARAMLQMADLERTRADRYQKVFSVALADVSEPAWAKLPKRQQDAAIKHLGTELRKAVRVNDHVSHARQDERHLIGVVLPETGPEGARIAAENLRQLLIKQAGDGAGVRLAVATYPGDGLDPILDLWRRLDRDQRV
jgi:GGDEF domain-containing protein